MATNKAQVKADLWLRTSPELDAGNQLRLMKTGEVVIVRGGTAEADGFTWWRVATEKGEKGWTSTHRLVPYTLPDPPAPTPSPNGIWCSPLGGTSYPPAGLRRSNWQGATYTLNGKAGQIHTGDDVVGTGIKGRPVYALHDGVVTFTGVGVGTWGLLLIYRVQEGTQYVMVRHAHLDRVLVQPGSAIKAGQQIATVGETGMPGIPHLHMDIGAWNDPRLLDSPQDWPSGRLNATAAYADIKAHYQDVQAFLVPRLATTPATPPPVVVVPPTQTVRIANRLGLHILPGADANRVIEVLAALQQRDRPVPLVLLLDVPGQRVTVEAVRRASPTTRVIVRNFGTGDYQHPNWDAATRDDGRRYYREIGRPSITLQGMGADFIQLRDINEPGVGRGTNEWWHGILDGAEIDGRKIAVYCWSMGQPDLTFWSRPDTHDLLRRVRDKGHALTVHQYAPMGQADPDWTDEWTIMRHRKIYAALPADLQALRLYVTEFGDGGLRSKGPSMFERNLRKVKPALANGPDVLTALWTLGDSGGWANDRFDEMLDVYQRVVLV